LKSQNKGVVFVGSSFIYGLIGNADLVPKLNELEAALQRIATESEAEDKAKKAKKAGPGGAAASAAAPEQKSKEEADQKSTPAAAPAAAAAKAKQLVRVKDTVAISGKDKAGKKTSTKVTGLAEFVVFAYEGHQSKVTDWFKQQSFVVSE
jgi:hypothetical protein